MGILYLKTVVEIKTHETDSYKKKGDSFG